MLNPKIEWPDVLEEMDHKRILLQHKMIFSRSEFDNHAMSRIANMLLEMGELPLTSTDEVRKYIFEVEIVD